MDKNIYIEEANRRMFEVAFIKVYLFLNSIIIHFKLKEKLGPSAWVMATRTLSMNS